MRVQGLVLLMVGCVVAVAGLAAVGCASAPRSIPRVAPAGVSASEDAALLERVRSLHRAAAKGDQAAAVEADAVLESRRTMGREGVAAEAGRDMPPVLRAYQGSVRMMRAQWASSVWDKGSLARQGAAIMDEAIDDAGKGDIVRGDAARMEARALRGLSLVHLPKWAGQRDKAVRELAQVAAGVEEAVQGGLPRELAAVVLYTHAQQRRLAGDPAGARAALDRAMALIPQGGGGTIRAVLERERGRLPADTVER